MSCFSFIRDETVSKGDIVVGNDVWIGTGALIMSGVKIGNGAVIAAKAVVTRNVPPYSIVCGVPARVIKMRFPDNIIEKLEMVKWWDYEDEKLIEVIPLLESNDINGLLLYAKNV